jgi:hypothetical protein
MRLMYKGVISALYMTTAVGTAILTPRLAPHISLRSDEKKCRKEVENVRRNQKREKKERALQAKANERYHKERDREERMTDEQYFGWMG